MKLTSMLRIFGVMAIAGGALRILSAFLPWRADNAGLEALYFAIDICLLFGLIGFYLARGRVTGAAGLATFMIAAAGVASIVGPDTTFLSRDMYQVGVVAIALGLALFSILLLAQKSAPKAPSYFWLAAVAAAVIAAAIGHGDIGFLAGGVLFGAGFMMAGLATLNPDADIR